MAVEASVSACWQSQSDPEEGSLIDSFIFHLITHLSLYQKSPDHLSF